jgi:hypothetical protein
LFLLHKQRELYHFSFVVVVAVVVVVYLVTDVGDAAIGVTGRRTDLQLVTSEIDLKQFKKICIYSDGQ